MKNPLTLELQTFVKQLEHDYSLDSAHWYMVNDEGAMRGLVFKPINLEEFYGNDGICRLAKIISDKRFAINNGGMQVNADLLKDIGARNFSQITELDSSGKTLSEHKIVDIKAIDGKLYSAIEKIAFKLLQKQKIEVFDVAAPKEAKKAEVAAEAPKKQYTTVESPKLSDSSFKVNYCAKTLFRQAFRTLTEIVDRTIEHFRQERERQKELKREKHKQEIIESDTLKWEQRHREAKASNF